MRIGFGYDIHPLVTGRPLILGGVVIPFEKGLDGHSDADVLCHAIGDAILGAAAMGDLGEHFPDTGSAYQGISSLVLLGLIGKKLHEKNYNIVNIDSTIVAEAPKLSSFREIMVEKIAEVLGLAGKSVSIKATTNEKFGATGRGEAIAAYAIVLVRETQK